jgi:hypothetical protein
MQPTAGGAEETRAEEAGADDVGIGVEETGLELTGGAGTQMACSQTVG